MSNKAKFLKMLLSILYTFCVYIVFFKCMCYYVYVFIYIAYDGYCQWQRSKNSPNPFKMAHGYFMKVKNNKHNFLPIIRYK